MLRYLMVCLLLYLVSVTQTKLNKWKSDKFDIKAENTLILTHVIFRHGNRTADRHSELYPLDPYLNEDYYPIGNGQLTKAGKQKQFSVGKALRNRYDAFLGENYYPDIIEAISTDYNRTKMSLQLVLAGLFPPKHEDLLQNDIRWQPVPFNYLPKYHDKVLLGVLCPRYLNLYEEVINSIEIQEEFLKYRDIFNYISKNTGLNITSFFQVYNLYFGLATEQEWGLKLPTWTEPVWPEIMVDLAIQEYYTSMATLEMRQMAIGYFLRKLIEDTTKNIEKNSTISTKMHLYSAHESNIAELLIALDVFEPHIPNYGSYVLIEIHRINGEYGVKIYYENYTEDHIQLLTLPLCGSFCELDKFIELIKPYFPSDDLCGP